MACSEFLRFLYQLLTLVILVIIHQTLAKNGHQSDDEMEHVTSKPHHQHISSTPYVQYMSRTSSVHHGDSSCRITLKQHTGPSNVRPMFEKYEVALLLVLGLGGLSLAIAFGYRALRKYVFHDEHNFDTVFDAGGRVSVSLTAVTVTSQMLWPADFLQLQTLNSKAGVAATLWMAVGLFVDIMVFPILSLYFKTRAPGAKTFPQIAYARFGKVAHVVFCILALCINLAVSMSTLLAGKTAIKVLCKDANNEFIYMMLAFLFGSYCLVGGLGTAFYMSYINTALAFICVSVYVLYTSFHPSPEKEDISTVENLYKFTSCLNGPDGNYDNSFLTFRSRSGVIYGVVVLLLSTSIGMCDQANWQSRIAAKPSQGILGYQFAAYLWFVLPATMAFTSTMSYMSKSFINGTHLLSEEEIDNGYITPYILQTLLGRTGGYLFLIMLMMALMSTGSGEVMSVSSIIVYDIYKTHINPFRKNLNPTSCILCGKEKITRISEEDHVADFCSCPSSIGCARCEDDIAFRTTNGKKIDVEYSCPYHGNYRRYEDRLMRYKTWCMVWIIVSIVPFGLIISETPININWTNMGIPVWSGSFLIPLFLTTSWTKATSQGVISGGLIGLTCSLCTMFIGATFYEGGLSRFFVNTVQDYVLLAAMLSGCLISGLITVVVSLCTHNIRTKADEEREWAKTFSIDNPINPFRLVYREELEQIGVTTGIITAKTMEIVFAKAKRVAIIGGGVSLVFFLVILPVVVLNVGVLSLEQFTIMIRLFQYCCFFGTVVVVIVPPVEEGYQIWRRYKENSSEPASAIALISL